MARILAAYLGAGIVMAILDLSWLKLSANMLYHPQLGALLADRTNTAAAIAFYLVYVAGIVWFAVAPGLSSDSLLVALGNGALFGFFAYATYDLTNLATVNGWPLQLSFIDMAWGTFATSLSALAGAFAAGLASPR
jgi:uncharacterized membrane protein